MLNQQRRHPRLAYSKRLKRLIGSEFKILPFASLSLPYQLAVAHYMAIDGEAWADVLDEALYGQRFKGELRKLLPRVCARYGESRFGVVELDTERVKSAIMQDIDIREDFPSWEAYHRWYLKSGPVPRYTRRLRWPVILASEDSETLQDGWHRLHSYVRAGHRSIPAVFYPPCRPPKAVRH